MLNSTVKIEINSLLSVQDFSDENNPSLDFQDMCGPDPADPSFDGKFDCIPGSD
jgi:hypothetical protein